MNQLLPAFGRKGTASASLFLVFIFCVLNTGCRKQQAETPSLIHLFPRIIACEPAADSTGVPVDAPFSVVFERAPAEDSFRITLVINGGAQTLLDTMALDGHRASFQPASDLEPETQYEVQLRVEWKGAGKVPALVHHWRFTTGATDRYRMTLRSTHVTDFARDGSRSMQIGSYLYSFGGWHVPEESFNDVYRSTGDLTQWEKRPDAPWHPRHVYGIGKLQQYTYIIGGDNLNSGFDVWRTSDGESWQLMASNLLDNRIYYGATAHDGYLYVVGGIGHHDVWRSPDGAQWTRVAEHLPFLNGENFAGSLASFNGRLYLIGGGGSGGGTGEARRSVWSSTDGRVWTREPDFPGTARYYTDLCVYDNKLWVIGGYSDAESNIRSIWYRKRNGSWNELPVPADYIGRHATGVATYNNMLAITCGNYHNDCWVIEKE